MVKVSKICICLFLAFLMLGPVANQNIVHAFSTSELTQAESEAVLNDGEPYSLRLSPNESMLAIGHLSAVTFWDTTTGNYIKGYLIESPRAGGIADIAWSPDGTMIAFSTTIAEDGRDNEVFIMRISDGELLSAQPTTLFSSNLAWNPSGSKIVVVGWETFGMAASYSISLYDVALSGQMVLESKIGELTSPFVEVRFLNDTQFLTVGAENRFTNKSAIIYWDTSFNVIAEHEISSGGKLAIYSNQSELKVAVAEESTIYLWDHVLDQSTNSWDLGTLFDDIPSIRHVSWSPNGQYLAVLGGPKIYVIDVVTGQVEQTDQRGRTATVWTSDSGTVISTPYYLQNTLAIVSLLDNTEQTPTPSLTSLPTTPTQTPTTPTVSNGKIAFVSEIDGDAEIFTINPDGTNLQQLTMNDLEDYNPTWSPSGNQIAFIQDGHLAIMNADGSNLSIVPNTRGADRPAWSPSGHQIALELFGQATYTDIFVYYLNSSKLTDLTNTDSELDQSPVWSPDGDQIAFVSSGGNVILSPIDGDPRLDIYVISTNGTNRSKISIDSFGVGSLNWGSNGAIIYSAGFEYANVYSINIANGTIITLTNAEVRSRGPSLSPDEQKIAYIHGIQVAIMDIDGNNIRIITDTSDPKRHLAWQPIVSINPTEIPTSNLDTTPTPTATASTTCPGLVQEAESATLAGNFVAVSDASASGCL